MDACQQRNLEALAVHLSLFFLQWNLSKTGFQFYRSLYPQLMIFLLTWIFPFCQRLAGNWCFQFFVWFPLESQSRLHNPRVSNFSLCKYQLRCCHYLNRCQPVSLIVWSSFGAWVIPSYFAILWSCSFEQIFSLLTPANLNLMSPTMPRIGSYKT